MARAPAMAPTAMPIFEPVESFVLVEMLGSDGG
jgi:hypothetical protein